ncbi:FAD-binding oxidoreductase [Aeromicrobium camelliae]|uniref:FAD-binding oxidoreductase n=2 Tax=Aeromicrobium camelliae TaxID=1538144 RepID=A0A3N6X3H6_9ACTN|nr:FAD-binding oxidoreductase [Aeromicrobium camelliae]
MFIAIFSPLTGVPMSQPRVVVIGAGVLGLFTAYELTAAGVTDVVVLEASHPGDGSSGRSVGMVETQYLTFPDVQVRAYGREVYAALERDHDLHFVHGGYLRLGRQQADITAFEKSLEHQKACGVDDAVILSPQDIAERWPHIVVDDLVAAQFGTWDGYVDGYAVSQLLAGIVKGRGATVVARAEVLSAQRTGDVWRLDTAQGVFEAEVVVNAAGPWAGHVGDLLDAPVPLLPQLHGALTIELGAPQPFTPFVMDYVPGSGTDGVYFRSERADQLIAGLHTDEAIKDPVSPDVPLGAMGMDQIERVITLLSERLVGADDMEIGRSWSGIYPMTPDHQPIAGWHRDAPGVVCALGAGGSGIQLSPAVGRLAADAILGRSSDFEIDWSHERFGD